MTGELVSYSTYWAGVAEAFAGARIGDGAGGEIDGGAEVLAPLLERFRKSAEFDPYGGEPDDDDFEPEHIHLRRVTLLGPGAPVHLPSWRGRLVSVSGWSLVHFSG